MMKHDPEGLLLLGSGPIVAVFLGMALIPLREVTRASNLTFAFLALIIIVAELGGKWPAMATAVSSAMSLSFFLTKPYLKLTVHGRDDVIAVAGLAVCGLIAAAFGPRRGAIALRRARRQLELLRAGLRELERAGPLETRVQEILDTARLALPIAAACVRTSGGEVLAASGGPPVTARVLEPPASWKSRNFPRRGSGWLSGRRIARWAGSTSGLRGRRRPLRDARSRTSPGWWRFSWAEGIGVAHARPTAVSSRSIALMPANGATTPPSP